MDMEELWSKTREVLRAEVNAVVYNSLLGSNNLVPALLDGDTLVLRVVMDNLKLLITNQWYSTIVRALSQVAGHQMDVEILTQEEIEARPQLKQKAVEEQETVLESSVALNPKYTFETFVVGSGNRFAHAAALSVATDPAHSYNPLFIYGGVGLGKTHLMHAVGNFIREHDPSKRILYIPGETFTNELISAIQQGRNIQFRNRFRSVDVLMVDDIQFIAGKESTQEEFFHTFNTLYESGRQIVLTSDRPPREMTQLEDRLQTRFEWGLMVDVAPPDFETRLAIIKNKAALLGVQLPDDISSFIAENLTANVRQIEGALNKLLAYRDLLGNQVDGEAVSRAVKDMLKKYNEFVPSPSLIIEYICRYYDVDEEQVRGQGRKRDLMEARQTAMYLIRRMTNLSLNDIGKEFGDRDHTTVLHSLDQVEKKMRSDPAYAEKVKEITTNINNKK